MLTSGTLQPTGPANNVKEAEQFLLKIFTDDIQKKNSYHHFTCATDTENIRVVFEAVRDTLISNAIDAFKLN